MAIYAKKGLRFYHARVLDSMKWDGRSPQLYEVTKVAKGMAYYRAVANYGEREALVGNPECCPEQSFYLYVKYLA